MSRILITGAAGFIGAALSKNLIKDNNQVIGIDNLNNYYDVSLKKARIEDIKNSIEDAKYKFEFKSFSIEDLDKLEDSVKSFEPRIIVNLAAQAGVRYSIINPNEYVKSNLVGFHNILHISQKYNIENLIYASSSSVYGGNTNFPFTEKQSVDHPVSFYAATKKCNEIMAHSYSHIYDLPVTGLRFFTVYGPWGRPDMAPMIFAKAILNNKEIKVFNNGEMFRDFTYIEDVVEAISKCCKKPAERNKDFDRKNPEPSTSFSKHRILNIGNSEPVKLTRFIELLEIKLGKKARKIYLPMQKGDVESTAANINSLNTWIGYNPETKIEEGLDNFVRWFKNYYHFQ